MSNATLAIALYTAADEAYRTSGVIQKGTERAWGVALAEYLKKNSAIHAAVAEPPHDDSTWEWTRTPGRFDLSWQIAGTRGVAELKLRKPEELIWDAIKIAERTGPSSPFEFGCLLVQVKPVDLTKTSGALLSGNYSGHQHPIDWIRAWPADWLWLLEGGRGIRPSTIPHDVKLTAPTVVGDATKTHLVLLPIERSSDLRDPLDEWGWPPSLGPRPEGWQDKVAAKDTTTAH